MSKVRIVSDGTSYSARISDAETGEELQYVTDAEIRMSGRHECPVVYLTVAMPVVDLIAEAKIKRVCPCCGTQLDREGRPL